MMQSTPGLTFETLDNRAGFGLFLNSSQVNVLLPDAPADYNIGQTPSAVILMVSDEIKATIYSVDDTLCLYLSKTIQMPQSFSLSFENINSISIQGNQLILHLNGLNIFINTVDCNIVAHDNNSATFMLTNTEAQIIFSTSLQSSMVSSSSLKVSALSIDDGRMVIPASRRIPEFIISIYDDSDYKRPRPSRFGVPVISTVPGFIPDATWNVTVPQEDKDLLELGVGTSVRMMHFRVVSDQTIDSSIRGDLSLEIDLPAGVDTVEETVSLALNYESSHDTNDVFVGSYEFHKEDTDNFVDGFAYLSVRLPLRIQRNLPLTFLVSGDGLPFEADAPVSSIVIPIDMLSVDTNAVQPKLANSEQGSKTSKGKNNKNGSKPKT